MKPNLWNWALLKSRNGTKTPKKNSRKSEEAPFIFSDSSSSGLFADYDSVPSDENESVDYSPREDVENRSSQDEGHSSLFDQMQDAFQDFEPPLLVRNDDLEWEHEDGWRKFGSVDNLNTLSRKKSKRGSLLSLRKTASLGRLNDNVRKKHANDIRRRFWIRWEMEQRRKTPSK